jgi:hypothetical protein
VKRRWRGIGKRRSVGGGGGEGEDEGAKGKGEEKEERRRKRNVCSYLMARRDFPLRHRNTALCVMSIGHMSKANGNHYAT